LIVVPALLCRDDPNDFTAEMRNVFFSITVFSANSAVKDYFSISAFWGRSAGKTGQSACPQARYRRHYLRWGSKE